MKKILLILLLACGATAVANNTDPIQEKRTASHVQPANKENAKAYKPDAGTVKPEAPKPVTSTARICSDNTSYGIGTYIAEFITRSNVKIMRKLLID